jgi:hypothetical protein
VLRHGALRVHDGRERCDGVVRGEQGRVEAEARVVVGTTEDEEGVVSGGEKDVVPLVERGRGLERRRRKRWAWQWQGRAARWRKKRVESDGSSGDQSFNLGWFGPGSRRTADLGIQL